MRNNKKKYLLARISGSNKSTIYDSKTDRMPAWKAKEKVVVFTKNNLLISNECHFFDVRFYLKKVLNLKFTETEGH